MKKICVSISLLLSMMAFAEFTPTQQILQLVPRDSAVFRYGYMQLNSAKQAMYDTILGSVLRFEVNKPSAYTNNTCPLFGVSNTYNVFTLKDDIARMYNDIPELYLLSSTIPAYDYTRFFYYLRIGFSHSPASYLSDLQAFRAAYDSCAVGITPQMTDYEKLKTLHDAYCRRTSYGGMTSGDAGTARGALVNRKAVCEGIARGWLYICQQAGFKCIYVSGTQLPATNHAWNYIQLDGDWYMMDLTADCGLVGVDVGYAGFLRGGNYQLLHYSLLSTDGTDPNCNGVYQYLPVLHAADYERPTATSFDNVKDSAPASKILHNGQLLIVRDGKTYAVTGAEIR